jgi:hypothetical protein
MRLDWHDAWPTDPVEESGDLDLWGGWSLTLPNLCMVARNADGSLSAWDHARTVDVHIVEIGGHVSGRPMTARQLLNGQATTSGEGWIGAIEILDEPDGVGPAWRFALTATAENTLISCWISYRVPADLPWAEAVARSLRHIHMA